MKINEKARNLKRFWHGFWVKYHMKRGHIWAALHHFNILHPQQRTPDDIKKATAEYFLQIMDADADMDPLTTDENIDERIARWHEAGDYSQPLHEYLGLTMEQYGHWVETGTLGRCSACGGQGWHAQFPANGDPPEQIQCEQCWGTGIT